MSTQIILSEWSAWQRGIGRAERTVRERDYMLSHFFTLMDTTPTEFTTSHAVRYLGRRDLRPASRASYHSILRAFTTWLIDTGQRPDDPLRTLPAARRPKLIPRPVTDAELIATLAHAQRRHTKTKIVLAALQGLRVAEVAQVRGEHLDLGAQTLRVFGKGSKEAVMPLHPDLVGIAGGYPARGPWFPSTLTRSGHVTGKSVSTVISKAMGRAGVAATPHQLRHWYGTRLLEEVHDLRLVQELMRHESIQSTQIYTLVSPERQRAALHALTLPDAA